MTTMAETATAETGTAAARGKTSVLVLSTIGFTLMFAVWVMFGVLGIPIRQTSPRRQTSP